MLSEKCNMDAEAISKVFGMNIIKMKKENAVKMIKVLPNINRVLELLLIHRRELFPGLNFFLKNFLI